MALPTSETAARIERGALMLRRDCLHMTLGSLGGGHVSPTLSCAEIVSALYNGVARIDPNRPDWPDRDRIILSKGHAVQALYSALARAGYFPLERLDEFENEGSALAGHPPAHGVPGIDFPSGSMGHGLPVAAGMAAGARLQGKDFRVFCICGDGELNEGSVWEGVMLAVKYKLDNLTVIVDHNGFQHDSSTAEIMPPQDLAAKFEAFGCAVRKVDGHDAAALYDALTCVTAGAPNVLLAQTVKGRGISFIENNNEWHHHDLTREQFEQGLRELGIKEDE